MTIKINTETFLVIEPPNFITRFSFLAFYKTVSEIYRNKAHLLQYVPNQFQYTVPRAMNLQ